MWTHGTKNVFYFVNKKKRSAARDGVFALVVGRLRPRGCCGVSPLLHFHCTASSCDSQFDILNAFTEMEKGFM